MEKENFNLAALIVLTVTAAIVTFWLLWWAFHDPYHMTAVYCNPDKTQCVYRERGIGTNKCPEWWNNSGNFDKVNNVKLQPESCHITKQ